MNRIPIILDCDTGVDDAIAIMLAAQVPKFNLRAVTTVAGNVTLDKTTANSLRILELIDSDFPVYAGAERPLVREPVTAGHVHGEDGLGGVELPLNRSVQSFLPAWDLIYQEACLCKGTLELIAVGPLTNLALAFIKYPDLAGLLKRIVVMGGSATSGNVTPAAEFNMYVDPEAAEIVFNSGVPVYMCGLDVTLESYYTFEDIEKIGNIGSKPARFFQEVLLSVYPVYEEFGLPGVCLHDPLTVLYAEDNSYFETHHVGIHVETKGELTRGKTVTDLYSDKKMEKNAYIVTDVDREIFQARVYELMASL